MKKLKISMLAVLFTVGIGGAVVQKIQAAPKLVDTFYDWTSTSIAPNHPSSNLSNQTSAQATTYFGCSSGSRVCATGSKVSGPGSSTAELDRN
jgi:hypothetical protein